MTRSIIIAATLALAVMLPAVPAQAQVARTFLSATGSDNNNCANVATPCRHLATAFAATAADGEIYVLDPANYGSLSITHAVSIQGHGWASIAPPGTGTAAITISAGPNDKININGVVLDGTAISGTTGIQFLAGHSLNIRDSVIRNFKGDGINFGQNSSGTSELHVSNSQISDNGGDGIAIAPTGSGDTNGALNHVEMENNAFSGLYLDTNSQTLNFVVTDCQSTDNSEGMTAISTGGTRATIIVRNSTITFNFTTGLHATGNGAQIWATRSTIMQNSTGWTADAPGIVSSYIDNNIDDNPNGNTSPPPPPTYAYK